MLFSSASIKGVSTLVFGKTDEETSSSTLSGVDSNDLKESRDDVEDDVEDDAEDDENGRDHYKDNVAANTLLELQNQHLKSQDSGGLDTKVETIEKKKATSRQKKKENVAISAQSILSCADRYHDAIKLVEHVVNSKRNVSTKNADIHLALKTMKKLSNEVDKAASSHMNTYAKEVRKRKRVEEMDNIKTKDTRGGNADVKRSRMMCKNYMNDNNEEIKEEMEEEKVKKKRDSIPRTAKRFSIYKNEKKINIPMPKSTNYYEPIELVECLICNVDAIDRRFVIKEIIKMGYVPVKNFRVILRHIQKYKAEKALP